MKRLRQESIGSAWFEVPVAGVVIGQMTQGIAVRAVGVQPQGEHLRTKAPRQQVRNAAQPRDQGAKGSRDQGVRGQGRRFRPRACGAVVG